jgi:formylglycine-generating enzyme required for sulfatase activity
MNLDESYRALGLKPGTTLQDARRAYHERLKFFHPDRYQSSPGLLRKATEETQKLNLAYECICKVLGTVRGSRAEASGNPPVPGEAYNIPCCGIALNWVAPGRFQMGSPVGEAGRSNDEGPQTGVTITRGFWLGRFPVTQEEWQTVVAEESAPNPKPSFFCGARLPVEQVSWDDCQQWVQELNALEKIRLPRRFEYRLPTEAEWEFACRAGTSTRFHCGDGDDQLGDYAWFSGNSGRTTHSVGEKKANDRGFYDVHGNVWEWCQDRYGGPLPGGTVTDPSGSAHGINRVVRGGSWGMIASRCRSAYRVWNKPAYRDYTIGFRIALASVD